MRNKLFIGVFLILILLVISLLYFFSFNKEQKLVDIFRMHKVAISNVEGFIIKKKTSKKITATLDNKKIKVIFFEDLKPKDAKIYIAEQYALFSGLFEPQLPPYPEFLTRETGCEEKFRPIQKSNKYGNYYIMYAGKRGGYGICTDDLIVYRASLGFFYCEQKGVLVQLKYFTQDTYSDNELIKVNESFRCL